MTAVVLLLAGERSRDESAGAVILGSVAMLNCDMTLVESVKILPQMARIRLLRRRGGGMISTALTPPDAAVSSRLGPWRSFSLEASFRVPQILNAVPFHHQD